MQMLDFMSSLKMPTYSTIHVEVPYFPGQSLSQILHILYLYLEPKI